MRHCGTNLEVHAQFGGWCRVEAEIVRPAPLELKESGSHFAVRVEAPGFSFCERLGDQFGAALSENLGQTRNQGRREGR